ncbi:hypothetical protein [Wenzhouxiangella marina]|uniref:homoserine dehydrogenase n=1 Tax=Wenzhouxiangella marina TaxID=1579979 RepID=A0A0K0XWY7_9GAMM|nr:hypothetical protein [Wenzhouxiangella marina]AKS42152.1 hypothetical protein WM2015_1785 [Wenzhouxiangella marina]MBB6086076.1 aspartokinase/homoserine dehydrogenase 1 [Wenzhouxiangella marina]
MSRPESSLSIALVGPGRVGRSLLERLQAHAPETWQLMAVADSTRLRRGPIERSEWAQPFADEAFQPRASDRDWQDELLRRDGIPVLIDASASAEVADAHADCLARGIHVVTANKLAMACPSSDWERLRAASERSMYGISATVGAGLPVLDSLRELRRAGEPVRRIRGVLSGSLSALSEGLSVGRRASEVLETLRRDGLTEPDPRTDLGGLDVARKLVILAREAGLDLSLDALVVDSLVPEELAALSLDSFLRSGAVLDRHVAQCVDRAPGSGRHLAYVAELEVDGRACVGLRRLDDGDSLAQLSGQGNRIEVTTECYAAAPLSIEGPGAGLEVTALALWRDLVRISESVRRCR